MATTLDFTKPHVLRTEEEYDAAIARIEELLGEDPVAGGDEHEELQFLSLLVEAYEDEHYPMGERGTPQSIVEFMLEQKGMDRNDISEAMGGRSRVSEFFSAKRALSRGQIERLRSLLGIPADLLL
jgi:HTH-type transcriptional regulator / antitoxin HigA